MKNTIITIVSVVSLAVASKAQIYEGSITFSDDYGTINFTIDTALDTLIIDSIDNGNDPARFWGVGTDTSIAYFDPTGLVFTAVDLGTPGDTEEPVRDIPTILASTRDYVPDNTWGWKHDGDAGPWTGWGLGYRNATDPDLFGANTLNFWGPRLEGSYARSTIAYSPVTLVPEPSSAALLGLGALGLLIRRKR